MRLEVGIVRTFEGADRDLPVSEAQHSTGGDQEADDDRLWKTRWRRHGAGLYY